MDERVKTIIEDCTHGSDQERLTFPEVVEKLASAGVERYHTDLVRREKIYYLPSGESMVVEATARHGQPAASFSAPEVEAAVRAIQARQIGYNEFCERIAGAGCASYVVSLVGRRVVYFGRSAESHVELMP